MNSPVKPAEVAPGLAVRVPLVGLLPEQGRRVDSPWGELAVFLLSDGSPRAVLNRCPHKGGTLAEGIVCGEYVFCTQHDWKICLKDGRAAPPDQGVTRVFRARLDGDAVVIEDGVATKAEV